MNFALALALLLYPALNGPDYLDNGVGTWEVAPRVVYHENGNAFSSSGPFYEDYTINSTQEVCGVVYAYSGTPDHQSLLRYNAVVRKVETVWVTKKAAEKHVEEECSPKKVN